MHLKFSGVGLPSKSSVPDNPLGSFLPARTSNNLGKAEHEHTREIEIV